MPETVFLHYLAAANERGHEITAQGLLRLERMLGSEAAPGTKPATNRRRRGETLDSEQISGKFTLRRSSAGDEENPTESIGELLAEIVNHLDLLARILMPVCEGADSPLKSAERRLIARLLPEIGELVRRLERTLLRDSDRQ